MGTPILFIASLGAVSTVGFFAWYFSAYKRNLRAIRKHACSAIRDVKHGEIVRIEGTMQPLDKPLFAPISGRPCAHYEVTVAEWVRRQKNSGWSTIAEEKRTVSFSLADGTGFAHVETKSFVASVAQDKHLESEAFEEPPQRILDLLRRHGCDLHTLFGRQKRFQYREGVLEPGEALIVVGRARWEDDPSGAMEESEGYREQRRKQRLVIEDHDDHVRATDDLVAFGGSSD